VASGVHFQRNPFTRQVATLLLSAQLFTYGEHGRVHLLADVIVAQIRTVGRGVDQQIQEGQSFFCKIKRFVNVRSMRVTFIVNLLA
jgi:hypothetical protein